MKRLLPAFLAALALAAGLLGWSALAGPTAELQDPKAGNRPEGTPEAEPRKSDPGQRRSLSPAAPGVGERSPEGPTSRVRVRVLWADDGSPVAGLPLTAAWSPEEDDRRSGVTDAGGGCGFALPADAPAITVRADATTSAPAFTRRFRLVGAGGEDTELEIRLPRTGVLAGHITDAFDRPLGGVGVTLAAEGRLGGGTRAEQEQEATTDGRGRFRFEGLVGDFELVVEADGHPRLEAAGHLEPGASLTGAILRLPEPRTVRVRVQTLRGTPIAAAALDAWRWLPEDRPEEPSFLRARRHRALGTTGEEGIVELAMEQGEAWRLEVAHPDYPPFRGMAGAWQEEVVVELGAPFELTGRVTTPVGTPVAGALLRLWVPVRGRPPGILDFERFREATSAADGTFRIPAGASTERGCLLARAAGRAVHVTAPLSVGPTAPPVDVTLQEGPAIAGVVVDRSGAPVAGAPVVVLGERFVHQSARRTDRPAREHLVTGRYASWEAMAGGQEVRSGEDGRFRFEELYDGIFDVRVRGEREHEWRAWVRSRSGREDLRIVLGEALDRLVTVRGRVTDARTGVPVPGFRFGIHRERDDEDEPLRVGRDLVHPEGRFEVAGVEPGELAFTVKVQGHATWVRAFEHVPAGALELEVPLWPRRELEIEVVDAGGQPLPGLGVHVRDEEGDRLPAGGPGCQNPESLGRPAETDDRGRALLRNLPAMRVEIVVEGPSREEPARFPVDLTRPREGIERLVVPTDPG